MRATAEAPCTVGNFGPGFDVLSLALDTKGDVVTLETADKDAVTVSGRGAGHVPTVWKQNSACAALDVLRERTGLHAHLRLHIEKGMPPGSGLGSSASSSAAAVRAFARLNELTLPPPLAIEASGAGEAVATGAAHSDDAAAALYGGLVIVGGEGPDAVLRLTPPAMHVVVARPDVELNTREMRTLIPQHLPRRDVVKNLSNVARIVHACHVGDAELLCRALDDHISKPYRSPRVQGFDAIEKAARGAGAPAFLLSGSGPAMAAVMPERDDPERVRAAMADALKDAGLTGDVFVTRPLAEVTGNRVLVP